MKSNLLTPSSLFWTPSILGHTRVCIHALILPWKSVSRHSQSTESVLKLMALHGNHGNRRGRVAVQRAVKLACCSANTAPLTLPHRNSSFPPWQCGNVALVFRVLHQLYLVFVIPGQGKIKPGWKAGKIALELGPSCSTGAAGAVQSGF